MERFKTLLYALLAVSMVALPAPAPATDVDGPNDCLRPLDDFGDAPEGIPCYPSGVIGKFPTCVAPGPVGTMELACPPISTPPGPAGFVHHVQPVGAAPHYWLGCYISPTGPYGIDSETDGKVNFPAVGVSACLPGLTTDCIETAFTPAMTFDQDECFGDGSDAGLLAIPAFSACHPATIKFSTANCGNTRQVFLNICVDMNADGDWNDNFQCPGACAYEWAVKNAPLVLSAPGCEVHTSPAFLIGPQDGPSWMRITISDTPMPDDFPWNGTAGLPGGVVQGGETEDYPVVIATPTSTGGSSWGRLKVLYR